MMLCIDSMMLGTGCLHSSHTALARGHTRATRHNQVSRLQQVRINGCISLIFHKQSRWVGTFQSSLLIKKAILVISCRSHLAVDVFQSCHALRSDRIKSTTSFVLQSIVADSSHYILTINLVWLCFQVLHRWQFGRYFRRFSTWGYCLFWTALLRETWRRDDFGLCRFLLPHEHTQIILEHRAVRQCLDGRYAFLLGVRQYFTPNLRDLDRLFDLFLANQLHFVDAGGCPFLASLAMVGRLDHGNSWAEVALLVVSKHLAKP